MSTPVIRPRYDPQLNCSIGGNFNIHPPTFSMDGRFPFYYAQGSFPMQNFSHFHPTLAGPFSDQAGPSGILSNRPDSPASVVTDSDSPTSSISSEGFQETQKKHYTCKAQHELYVNAAVFLEKRHSGFACIHLHISDTG